MLNDIRTGKLQRVVGQLGHSFTPKSQFTRGVQVNWWVRSVFHLQTFISHSISKQLASYFWGHWVSRWHFLLFVDILLHQSLLRCLTTILGMIKRISLYYTACQMRAYLGMKGFGSTCVGTDEWCHSRWLEAGRTHQPCHCRPGGTLRRTLCTFVAALKVCFGFV
jgi:hypothetical protein